MNQGIHFVDLLMSFLGEPGEVSGMTGSIGRPGLEVEDTAAAIIRFTGGALATVLVSTSARCGPGARLQLHGTEGSISICAGRIEYAGFEDSGGLPMPEDSPVLAGIVTGSQAPAPQTVSGGAAGSSAIRASRGDPAVPDDGPLFADHLRQYHDVVAAIRDGRPPLVPIDEGVRALALVSAVYASSGRGGTVRYGEILSGADA